MCNAVKKLFQSTTTLQECESIQWIQFIIIYCISLGFIVGFGKLRIQYQMHEIGVLSPDSWQHKAVKRKICIHIDMWSVMCMNGELLTKQRAMVHFNAGSICIILSAFIRISVLMARQKPSRQRIPIKR